MILPIVAYGHPILRKVAREIDEAHPDLNKLLEDMWETMYASNGVGLAAPQVNRDSRSALMPPLFGAPVYRFGWPITPSADSFGNKLLTTSEPTTQVSPPAAPSP